jgi:hypothetical protein
MAFVGPGIVRRAWCTRVIKVWCEPDQFVSQCDKLLSKPLLMFLEAVDQPHGGAPFVVKEGGQPWLSLEHFEGTA